MADRVRPAVSFLAIGLAVGLAVGAKPAAAQQPEMPAADSAARGVRAGDLIVVWVWRERELSGEFAVDTRGRVVLPLLGEIMAAGKSADTLATELRAAYRRFLSNPSIQVTVLRRVAVLGQVTRPGLYPVDPTLTVATVVALAGGVAPNGDPRKIRLVRSGRVISSQLGPTAVLEQSSIQSGDEIYVPERPWLSRNSAALFWSLLATVTAAVTVSVITR